MVQRRNQSEHDAMVSFVVAYMKGNSFTDIKADIPGYTQPACIYWTAEGEKSGHRPDATGVNQNGVSLLFEVETADTIAIEHTASQWKLFSAFAKQHNKTFYAVVPRGSSAAAQKEIERLGITAKVWEVSP